MPVEDDDQFAPEQASWSEDFQRNILNAGWPITVPPAVASPYTAMAPLTPGLIEGRMAVSTVPQLPPQEYPPMISHLLPSNDPTTIHSATASTMPTSAQDTALRFQSQIAQTFPWRDRLPNSPHLDPSQGYGYLPVASSSTPYAVGEDTLAMTPIPATELSHTTYCPSNVWEVAPISQLPSLASSRPSGPQRSRRSISQRVDPLAAPSGRRTKQAKRAAACWRCRKYRKPVSYLRSEKIKTILTEEVR